jgi:allantoinase
MPVLARLGVPLIVHAEIESDVPSMPSSEPENHYAHYLHSRPPEWECRAIELMIELSKKTRCAIHIVHLSAADALPMIKKAREDGVIITVETCPHYLHLSAEAIQDGATHFKCAPPIRERENRERLWEGIRAGLIDFVVSDHSPCVPKLKCMDTGNFMKAWGGIAGLQMSPSVVWTEMSHRKMTVNDLSRLMSLKTAELVGLSHRKAQIKAGFDADFIFFDDNCLTQISESQIFHKNKLSPYTGEALRGAVSHTFVRGQLVYDQGKFSMMPSGQELLRRLS